MILVITIISGFLFLSQIWPRIMGVWIKRIHLSEVAKVKSQEQTTWLLLIAFCLWTYSWAGIVIASDDVNGIGDWLTAGDPAIEAVSAVFFTYSRLFPNS